MNESWRSRLARWRFNTFPAYRGSGGRVTFIRHDFMEVRVKLPLWWRTRNYVGTIFGGSIYASVDPFYMMMLIQCLGPGYVVWDKTASIRFRRPGRATLYAAFQFDQTLLDGIKAELESVEKLDRHFTVELKDAGGEVHAIIEKTVNVRKRIPTNSTG
jgi:acyl-coenzyme A thioesterase PaaI-like protein